LSYACSTLLSYYIDYVKYDFNNKIALVTGGSSGIGLAVAILLAQKGCNVWLLARNQDRLQSALTQVEAACKSQDQKCGFIAADISNIDQTNKAVMDVTRHAGAPDILINSAGEVYPVLFCEMDCSISHKLMEINYFGMVHITRACLPAMITRRSGYIVNISSVYGFLAGYGYTAYCASKYAVRGFTDALRSELKPLGIGISIVFPQNTATPQLDYENTLKSPLMKAIDTTGTMTADAVARAIMRGISRGQYVIIPGAEGKFYFWLSHLLGTGIYRIMDMVVASAQKKITRVRE